MKQYHNNSLAGHFSIIKTKKLINLKYYCLSFLKNVKIYVQDCNICLAFKVIKHKFYNDLQALPILIHQ